MRAGWATGVVSDPNGFRVDWTDEGLENLRLLYALDPLNQEKVVLVIIDDHHCGMVGFHSFRACILCLNVTQKSGPRLISLH